MNLHAGTIASVCALLLVQTGIAKADTQPSLQNTPPKVLAHEEALIAATLNDLAKAESQIFNTKDATSILHFYTEDYFETKDGKLQTGRGHRGHSQYLAEVLAQVNSDEPIGISSKFMNIEPSALGTLGWATYEY